MEDSGGFKRGSQVVWRQVLRFEVWGLVFQMQSAAMVRAAEGQLAALAAALLGDANALEKALQDTGMLPQAALHAQVEPTPPPPPPPPPLISATFFPLLLSHFRFLPFFFPLLQSRFQFLPFPNRLFPPRFRLLPSLF